VWRLDEKRVVRASAFLILAFHFLEFPSGAGVDEPSRPPAPCPLLPQQAAEKS
jgi:hypothetical protein